MFSVIVGKWGDIGKDGGKSGSSSFGHKHDFVLVRWNTDKWRSPIVMFGVDIDVDKDNKRRNGGGRNKQGESE